MIVQGKVALIPNSASVVSADDAERRFVVWGKELETTPYQQWVDVIAFNDECDNWCDGKYLKEWACPKETGRTPWFPSQLPASLFYDKKEGDTISFTLFHVSVVLTIAQKEHKYGTYGAFKDVFAEAILPVSLCIL